MKNFAAEAPEVITLLLSEEITLNNTNEDFYRTL